MIFRRLIAFTPLLGLARQAHAPIRFAVGPFQSTAGDIRRA